MSRITKLAIALAFASAAGSALAQSTTRTPLPADHPLIGTWKLEVPAANCHEIYRIKADGSSQVTSAAQTVETDFAVASKQSGYGFYKWVDTVTAQNGKPDCTGRKIETGHVATNYAIFNRDDSEFLLCAAEDINTCVGPFVRQPG
jgi:hypothetical protein